ncbi:hypothetical protein [Rhodoblastus sp.]|uniref:hypothetical protein n=1 Tax=Rhodoblastus sp. TaxID=1962975 RepID=UPI003F9B73A4
MLTEKTENWAVVFEKHSVGKEVAMLVKIWFVFVATLVALVCLAERGMRRNSTPRSIIPSPS